MTKDPTRIVRQFIDDFSHYQQIVFHKIREVAERRHRGQVGEVRCDEIEYWLEERLFDTDMLDISGDGLRKSAAKKAMRFFAREVNWSELAKHFIVSLEIQISEEQTNNVS